MAKNRLTNFSFSWAERNSAIIKLLYNKDIGLLIAGCKNNMVKFSKLTDNWVNVEVKKIEDEEIKKINNEIVRRLFKQKKKLKMILIVIQVKKMI